MFPILNDLQAFARQHDTGFELTIKQSDPAMKKLMNKMGFMHSSADKSQWFPAAQAYENGDQGSDNSSHGLG